MCILSYIRDDSCAIILILHTQQARQCRNRAFVLDFISRDGESSPISKGLWGVTRLGTMNQINCLFFSAERYIYIYGVQVYALQYNR